MTKVTETIPLAATEPYQARLATATALFDQVNQRWHRVANLRLIAFVGAAAAAAWAIWGQAQIGWPLAAILLLAFIALAVYHARLGRERAKHATMQAVQRDAIARIERRWADLPTSWQPPVPPDHPYAFDLDIVGRASLLQLLNTTATRMGRETLSAWLLTASPPEEALARQGAVAELASQLDLRQDLEHRGRAAANDEADPAPFLAWAEGPDSLSGQAWLRWYAWLGPAALVILAVASYVGLTPYPLWAIPLLLNLAVGATAGRSAYHTISAVAADHRAIAAYAGQLELLTAAPFTDPHLQRLHATFGAGEASAPVMLRRLGSIASMAIPPSSMLYLPIQALTLWDVHVVFALERWKHQVGSQARAWLEALGTFEALAALAGLYHDNPTWVFPQVSATNDRLVARQIGHPLLREDVRVRNDVTLGPPGTFLLVTGSNMSGKSTLLRSIGVNTVLAQAGGAVCADALSLPPVAIWTSVRVQDSLERGVSFFLAELQRLKLVVDAATQANAEGGPRVLYLLDEILQGTNTAERSVAARQIIAYLVQQGAIGAVSTHDLALADDPRLAPIAHTVHFTDTIGEGPDAPPMSFDYRLRPGVATTTNALRLMRLIGLDLDDATPDPEAIARP
jgi:ABC-type multidrug transport system fused ATPase/permease subunit